VNLVLLVHTAQRELKMQLHAFLAITVLLTQNMPLNSLVQKELSTVLLQQTASLAVVCVQQVNIAQEELQHHLIAHQVHIVYLEQETHFNHYAQEVLTQEMLLDQLQMNALFVKQVTFAQLVL